MTPFLHPAAEAEHLESLSFYDSRRQDLGGAYLADFVRTVERIMEAPARHRIERQPNIRKLAFERFPYAIIYRDAASGVQILAVSHKRRRPAYWIGRL
ncbi:MAG: hypothetical protein QM612_10965 [Thermomonas sp.]|uniref:hypothetical protein n=1 Tax=Thermomonas sp. TaxID=1971895 RepID=UPI0039E2506F